MRKNKQRQFHNAGSRTVVVGGKVTERSTGAAAVGQSVVVIDKVAPVTTLGTALNVPNNKPKVTGAKHRGFMPTIVTNKQDRNLDRREKAFDAYYYNAVPNVQDSANEYAKLNNAAVHPIEIALTMKPHNVAELVEETDLSKHDTIGYDPVMDMIYNILTGNTYCSVSKFVTANVSDYPSMITLGASQLQVGTVVRVTYPATSPLPLTAADTDALNISPATDSDIQNCKKANDMLRRLQSYYAKFPATLEFTNISNGLGGILVYNFSNEIWFVFPSSNNGAQAYNSANWRVSLTISSRIYSDYHNSIGIQQQGDKIQEISAGTPGLSIYSNANIAAAKCAVNFKAMAIARNDTINPCFTTPLVKLDAMIRRNTLLAATAQVTVNAVKALQELAETTEPFWPGWYNSVGAEIRSKREEFDARVAGLLSNLNQVRVIPSVYVDIVQSLKIGFAPRPTEGQLKLVVPYNAAMPATLLIRNLLTNIHNGTPSYNLSGTTFLEALKTVDAIYTTTGANSYRTAIDKLLDYISFLARTLKNDSIMTLNAATACYTVLSDAPLMKYEGLATNTDIINKYNAKQQSVQQIAADDSTYATSGAISDVIKVQTSTAAHGVELDSFRMQLPSVANVPSAANSAYANIIDVKHDAEFSTARQVIINKSNGAFDNSIDEYYDKQATMNPQIAAQYELTRTDGNDVAAYDLACNSGFAVYTQHDRGYSAPGNDEVVVYFRNQLISANLDMATRIEPYASYINSQLYNRDDYWYAISENVEGQYNVVDVPTYNDEVVVALSSTDHAHIYIHFTFSMSRGGGKAWSCNKVEVFNFWKVIKSGFGLTYKSMIYAITGYYGGASWYNDNAMPDNIPASVLLNDYSTAGIMRAYNGGSFDTMKYQYASHYSLLYLTE